MIAQVSLITLLLIQGALCFPADHGVEQKSYKDPGMPYNFAYGVKDDYAGTDFGQQENSDGNTVKGSYTVQLPDGRKQTVNYAADHYNGFVADVQYYGEAQYPHDYAPAVTFPPQGYGHSAPVYQPQPTYS
ncbi:cuticle protein 7-like isoform X2 [Portunus trituberculatus]|uniref:cuticle protein 7-like isoform X1 n=1 Tax=Portunus trituberculatus TaxID=210409 RepID=UPI001E1D17FF|nr:cuticle protein 7-like isoform X1 [Portunus trituberculatus]XP_045101365.1 cuticle protein 7-like isoform X2 [Portunus trituberculatus]